MPYCIGFVMEQTLGHVTHDRNLRQWAVTDSAVCPTWMEVPFDAPDRWAKAPGIRSNWTLRASLRARERVRPGVRRGEFDGLFFHTQVTALFSARTMDRVPTVVSLDATPINVDSVGQAYNHAPSGSRRLEALKNALNRRTFRSTRHLITWCEWAKRSLVEDYEVSADKVTVIPPGIDLDRWQPPDRSNRAPFGPVRLLFVGGDFRRKGGETLLGAFRRDLAGSCELDIVTREPVDTGGLSGVRVHHGLTSNAPELRALYADADVFVFPTLGDCLPIAIMEAMASGLPVVSTQVGAIAEEVEDGRTGFLIPPGNSESVAGAVTRLAEDAPLRAEMGRAGREKAMNRFDGRTNYREVLAVCKRVIDAG